MSKPMLAVNTKTITQLKLLVKTGGDISKLAIKTEKVSQLRLVIKTVRRCLN